MNLLIKILGKFKKKEAKRNVISINFDDIKPSNTMFNGQKMSPNKNSEIPAFKIKL
jgi:hypothetical protein